MEGWRSVAQVITDRMAERGMTQRELSEASGVSVATLRELQRGVSRRRSPVMLAAISRALGFPDSHLRDLVRQTPAAAAPQEQPLEVQELRERVAALEHTVAALGNRVSAVEKRAR